MEQKAKDFLERNNFCNFHVPSLAEKIYLDMENGLTKNKPASQLMIKATSNIPNQIPYNQKIIVIDAGGTNFRSCILSISKDENVEISDLRKTIMPASDCRLSKKEFYKAIADNIDYLKDKSSYIGFCFSYAIEITENGDGKIITLSKQIDAPEIKGTFVGQELMNELKLHGWKSIQKITIVNDTMAALLSGMTLNEKYDSYIGFILGTGINNAYIERQYFKNQNSIIVCECGCFNEIEQTKYDKIVDYKTINPGNSILEKMCSGAYEGKVAQCILNDAIRENQFNPDDEKIIESISSVTPYDMDCTLCGIDCEFTEKINQLSWDGIKYVKQIFSSVIERTASIVAAVLCATIKKSIDNSKKLQKICIICNGSTFWKTKGLKDLVNCHISEFLKENKLSDNVFFVLKSIDDDIAKGTAISHCIYKN